MKWGLVHSGRLWDGVIEDAVDCQGHLKWAVLVVQFKSYKT